MKKILYALLSSLVLLLFAAPLPCAARAENEAFAAAAMTPSSASLQDIAYDALMNSSVFNFLYKAVAIRTRSNLGVLSRINAQAHREHNKAFDQGLYANGARVFIADQHEEPVASMLYGTRNMWYNGCELAAVYNALLALGQPRDMSEIVYDFESAGAVWLEAEFGTKIAQYMAYLRTQGLTVKEYRQPEALDKERRDGDVFILSFRNNGNLEMHTIMAMQTEGVLVTYNPYGSGFDSLAALLRSNGIYFMGCKISVSGRPEA